MKLRIAILFYGLFYANIAWAKVSIRGKILGYDGKSIVSYHETIEGIYTPYWKEVKPASNGSFKIEYESEGYGNTRISYKGLVYRFFHDTNSKIYFEINEIPSGKSRRIKGEEYFLYYDSIKQASAFKIDGDYKTINQFYNENLRSSYLSTRSVSGSLYSHLISNADTPSKALFLLDSLTQIEIDQINQMPLILSVETQHSERKEEEVRRYLVNEVHAFYGAIFINGMFLKRKEHVTKLIMDSIAEPNIYNRDWELLIEDLNKQMKDNLAPIPSSPDYNDFMESMANTLSSYRQYDFPHNSVSLDEIVTDELFKYDTNLFVDKTSRSAHELNGLQRFLNDQLFFSPALLHAVYDLQAKHPSSLHFKFYQPQIEKLKNSLERSKQEFIGAKIIETNYNSFGSLIKRFEGKNLLIDIWATWCHPCIEDFKSKDIISPFIERSQIEVLYISIDKQQWDDRWRQSVRINELVGNHFRANPKLIEDMWNVIGDFQGAIPRYVLIDKQGRIFKSTAARPREGNELIQQIEQLINN